MGVASRDGRESRGEGGQQLQVEGRAGLELSSYESGRLSRFGREMRREWIEQWRTDWADEPGRSRHIELYAGDEPVVVYRLTEYWPTCTYGGSILQTWTDGSCPLPYGPHVVEMSRLAVAPTWRGKSLFEATMLDALLRVRGFNGATMLTLIVSSKNLLVQRVIKRLGVERIVTPETLHSIGVPDPDLPYVFKLNDERATRVLQSRSATVSDKLAQQGFYFPRLSSVESLVSLRPAIG